MVADRIGAPQDTMITRWERGNAFPSPYYIERLCQLFGMTATELGLLPEEPAGEAMLADIPASGSLTRTLHNLPLQPTSFLGREHEVNSVGDLLRRHDVRLVTLTGTGGIGKTRLALQVAEEVSDQFADGVFFVGLAPVSDAVLVVPTIMQALSIKEAGDQPLLTQLKVALKDRQMLLLLDNFEQVIEAAIQVAELLIACPDLKILVTSRIVLRVQAEREFAVPPLSLPNPNRLSNLGALAQYEAVALFIQRAQVVKADFQVTQTNAPTVAAICVRSDGLPLAIELALPASSISRFRCCSSVRSKDSPSSQAVRVTCRPGNRPYTIQLPGATICSRHRSSNSFGTSPSLWAVAPGKPLQRFAPRQASGRETCWSF